MFQAFITILTATTFVAHGLFGCCWHHDHGQESLAERASGQNAGCRDAGCQGHTHSDPAASEVDHATGGEHDDECPSPSKCEGHCIFARTQDSVDSSTDLVLASVTFLVVAGAQSASSVCEVRGTSTRAGFAAPSSPHCALSQVWLI
jgi:hypothetical protein